MIPGVAELVPGLAARYRLAIVTSSEPEPFARTHARTGLLPHFELVLTRATTSTPSPTPIPTSARSRAWASPARCLVIEDSERGLRAAKAAGLRCWVVPSGLTTSGNFAAADAVFPDLSGAAADRSTAATSGRLEQPGDRHGQIREHRIGGREIARGVSPDGTTQQQRPAALAARRPRSESSITRQRAGATPRRATAVRYGSGSGLDST